MHFSKPLALSRFMMHDSKVSMLVKIHIPHKQKSNHPHFIIQDRDFIHIPKPIREYESKTDIMGIDLGSTRCVLAVSRNKQIDVIPFDTSSPGDLWTESVISFDGEKPCIGKAASKRLKTKSDYVVFDIKLVYSDYHRTTKSEQSIWSFKFNMDEKREPYLELMTYGGFREFTLADINQIFLEQMQKEANEYQKEFNNEEPVRRAVVSVPYYSGAYVPSVLQAAKSANIEIIDVIEEIHADLLYYLSKKGHSEKIKPEMKIAVFDIGGGTCICKIYEISEHEGKKYATCSIKLNPTSDINSAYSGRNIDDIIIEELEESIPEDLRNSMKLRTWEMAKKIKHDLSFEKNTQ